MGLIKITPQQGEKVQMAYYYVLVFFTLAKLMMFREIHCPNVASAGYFVYKKFIFFFK